jgi:hypothetical protein
MDLRQLSRLALVEDLMSTVQQLENFQLHLEKTGLMGQKGYNLLAILSEDSSLLLVELQLYKGLKDIFVHY